MSTVKSKKLQVGTDASASNNFTIYQPSTPDGTLRIGVGNADSPTEVGRFTSAGYKPATAPTFFAYNSASLSVSAASNTKMVFNIVDFDTNSNYSTANNRFQPTVAGYYQISCAINFQSAGNPQLIQMWKNGANFIEFARTKGFDGTLSGSVNVYANGTTDYFEMYVYTSAGGVVGSNSGRPYGWFTAHLVQQA